MSHDECHHEIRPFLVLSSQCCVFSQRETHRRDKATAIGSEETLVSGQSTISNGFTLKSDDFQLPGSFTCEVTIFWLRGTSSMAGLATQERGFLASMGIIYPG